MPLQLVLRPWARWLWVGLNVLPLPGAGAVVAGWQNPHTHLRRNGALQMTLVLLGSYPLVVPGLVGFAWAVTDAVRMGRARLSYPPKGTSTP
ncbi:MAG: hypothetical protein ACYDBQ_01480 [Thermoplasmatota archaeon]